MPADAPLTPRAAERLAREAAVQPFDGAARSLCIDWRLESLDGKQVQRWGEALGGLLVRQRDSEVLAYREGHRPQCPANEPQLMVIGMGDGGNWIDPLLEREFRLQARIIDWCHASEHLWDCAKAIHGAGTAQAALWGEQAEALLWDGRVDEVIAALSDESNRLGEPTETDPPQHPRCVLHQNVGYFTRHKAHMNYPEYRRRGWPIGSGVTEAAVKQFNKRVKGTEQFWSEGGVETVLALRMTWVSQDQRWERHWDNRPAYVK